MPEKKHRLLIQKLLVSIHYVTLFRDEIILVQKSPSLLGEHFKHGVVQMEMTDIIVALDQLSEQEKLIKSVFWYDEPSFKLINHTLEIVDTWLKGVDHVIATCHSKTVFQAILGDNRQEVFGILTDVFTSLKIINLSIKEESEYPSFRKTIQLFDANDGQVSKEELLAKIDALSLSAQED